MYTIKRYQEMIESTELDSIFTSIYTDVNNAKKRLLSLIDEFKKEFKIDDNHEILCFSTPGRTEIIGNHTDHQHGKVLAGAISQDIIAVGSLNNTNKIRLKSLGWDLIEMDINELEVNEKEKETTLALLRGIIASYHRKGYKPVGFDLICTSEVLPGSGLSSSAAIEVLIAMVASKFFKAEKVNNIEWAKIGKEAENIYFGKPCGLMDQMACALGSIVYIDFKDSENPIIEPLNFDLKDHNYSLCILDVGASHANLTNAYASIPREMKEVANYFDKQYLREVEFEEFLSKVHEMKDKVSDRSILRALHFFSEQERVEAAVSAIKKNDLKAFLNYINESGKSSWMYLQNIYPDNDHTSQAMSVALALTKTFLKNEGALRVHGGGFAGTIQVFVENNKLSDYVSFIERYFGKGSCKVLTIRKLGAIVFE